MISDWKKSCPSFDRRFPRSEQIRKSDWPAAIVREYSSVRDYGFSAEFRSDVFFHVSRCIYLMCLFARRETIMYVQEIIFPLEKIPRVFSL